jgi:ferritin-like metal-binding protein YciE
MIEKAKDASLKKALRQHLKVTEDQKARLDEVRSKLDEATGEDSNEKGGNFLAGLFGKGNKECKGMKGLITEGNKVMGEDMSNDVMDAAIIACAQKIEHYEICGYGTARAYAQELNLDEVEQLLAQTLDEEYEADDLLTKLAVGRLNKEANGHTRRRSSSSRGRATAKKTSSTRKSTTGRRSASRSKSGKRSKASSR